MRDALGRSPQSAAPSAAIGITVQLIVGLQELHRSHLRSWVVVDRWRDIARIFWHMYSYRYRG
eukprot:9467759-Heterocapsa_arctica.AAC.1